MSSTVEVSRSPLPANVADYEGKWIAIRDGEVVASADTLGVLTQDERVLPTDVLYRVPEYGTYYY